MLVPLSLPPGIYKNGTEYQSGGRWWDANLVRFYERTVRPVGGWRDKSTSAVTGAARALTTWRDNSSQLWAGIGTHSKLYAMTQTGVLHDITPSGFTAGREDAVFGGGFGGGTYNTGVYGEARTEQNVTQAASMWTLDTWGEYLVGCMSEDGKLYEWQLDTATAAATISGAPTGNTAVLVTDERIMMALGAGGNPRKVQWSDQEDNTTWTPAATNQAGDQELKTGGRLLTGKVVRGGILLFTDVDIHFGQYVGTPFVYGFERIGSGCGAVSQQCVAVVDSQAFWMSRDGFWSYNGYVSPLPSEVGDYVFSDLNRGQASKIYAVHNSAFGEVWWFYPSLSSVENDRYVIYNYREGHWSIGQVGRTAGTDRDVFSYPLMIDSAGQVHEHEIGWDYDGDESFVEGGPIELGRGDRVMRAQYLIPDEKTQGDVEARFYIRLHPNGDETTVGPYTLSDQTDVRFEARQVSARFTGARNTGWRVGVPRLDVKGGGRR